MQNITEHHSKQEWKSNRGEKSWIDFLVGGDTVGVHYLLEGPGEVVALYEGRSREILLVKLWNLMNLRAFDVPPHPNSIELLFEGWLHLSWAPKETHKQVLVVFEFVKLCVNRLLH